MTFDETIRTINGDVLRAAEIATLQVNVGYACNMACKHCHLSAGPGRTELMSRETMNAVLSALKRSGIKTMDITGGAPELNPELRYFISEAAAMGTHIIVRTNLTVLLEPGMEDFPAFYANHHVELAASLPHFTGSSVDRVRGEGTFEKCIRVIKRLNGLGYGKPGSGLCLNLVCNPPGAILPKPQLELEERYREEFARRGIVFNNLLVLANMAMGRFREFLVRTRGLDSYMTSVRKAFNPATVDGLMCRYLVSVRWDGALFDCDFNQAIEVGVDGSCPGHISQFDAALLSRRRIMLDEHCFVCTAGSGTSCSGAIA